MTDREKLIFMLRSTVTGFSKRWAEVIADYLIDNSVTFEKDTDVHGKWISATERLPETYERVLTSRENGCIEMNYLCKINTMTWDKDCKFNTVTHWMPLPKPPKRTEHDRL